MSVFLLINFVFYTSLSGQVQINAVKVTLDKQQLEQLDEKCVDCSVYAIENADALLTVDEMVTLSFTIGDNEPIILDLVDNQSIISSELTSDSEQSFIKLLRAQEND